MLKLVSAALVTCWALCIFLRCLLGEMGLGEGTQRAPSPARRRQPAGLEWRKIGRLPAGRIVAVQVRVILA